MTVQIDPFGPLDEAALADIEATLNVSLPDSYRSFLAATGGGWVERPNHLCEPGIDLGVLYGAPEDPGYQLIEAQRGDFVEILPEEVIAVGGGNGGMVCLAVSGPEAGRVFWVLFDDLAEVPEGERSWEPLALLAGDFDQFLRDCLRPGVAPGLDVDA